MLVLTRNRGQSIIIGDDIRVTVMFVSLNRVRLLIDAHGSSQTRMLGIRDKINITQDIAVTLGRMKNNGAAIGIEAPQNIRIWREEIYNRIQREGLRHE